MPVRKRHGGKKRKRAPGAGRPKKHGPLITRSVYLGLTDDEAIRYEAAARDKRLTLSFYLRLLLDLPIEGAIKRRDQ